MANETYPAGDSNDAFDALIKATWEQEPSMRELLDAGVRRLLDDAKSLEDSLNGALAVSENAIQEALLHLNGDWDMLGFGDDALKVTGKLRPTEHAIENDIEELDDEAAFVGLGERANDLLGSYCQATHFRVIMRGFDVETIPLGKHGSSYRVVMQLSLDEDYNDEEVWFTAYPDDIEYIEAYQPTREGAEEFVKSNFPELYTAVQALPDNCQDPELIRQALDDFVVSIDLSRADTAMGEDEVLDLIETFITDRLSFDNASYEASVDGLIYGRRMNFDKVPKQYKGTLRQLLIGNVRLFQVPGTVEGEKLITYRPALETWYLVPEAQGGRTPIFIPIDSLTKLVENRPSARDYPFDEDTFIVQNEQMENDFTVAPLPSLMGSTAMELASVEVEQRDTEAVPIEGAAPEFDADIALRFTDELNKLYQHVYQYVSVDDERLYDSEAEAAEAYQTVSDRIQAFFDRWEEEKYPVIEAMGMGVRLSATQVSRTIDIESQHVATIFDGFGLKEAGMLNSAKGYLVEANVRVLPAGEDGEKRALRAYLEFVDLSSTIPGANIVDSETGLVAITNTTTRRFFVDLGHPVGYSIPDIEYLERRNEAIANVKRLEVPKNARRTLEKNLEYLAHGIDNESRDALTDYDGVEGLRDIALSITDNKKR